MKKVYGPDPRTQRQFAVLGDSVWCPGSLAQCCTVILIILEPRDAI